MGRTPMTRLTEGEQWYDPVTEEEFTVKESVKSAGRSIAELDRETVRIEYDDGETLTVPHERFRGRATYEKV